MIIIKRKSKIHIFFRFLFFAVLAAVFSLTPFNSSISALENNYSDEMSSEIIICLDPGHGGKDTGATGPSGLLEKDVNLDIAVRVKSKLNNAGFQVIMTRSDDTYLTDEERIAIAQNGYANIFVSIHCNELNTSEASGSEIFYCSDSPAISRNLADIIHDRLIMELSSVDRGVKTANFYILSNTHMVSTLVKGLFITNPSEEEKLNDRTYRDKIASAVSAGINDFIDSFNLLPFKAGIDDSGNTPPSMKPGLSGTVELIISNNTDSFNFPSSGSNRVSVSYHLYDSYNDTVIFDASRAALGIDLKPGESTAVRMTIKAPQQEGNYIIEYDLVQEGVAWFSSRGNQTLKRNILVSSSAPENNGQQQNNTGQSSSGSESSDKTGSQSDEDSNTYGDGSDRGNSIDYYDNDKNKSGLSQDEDDSMGAPEENDSESNEDDFSDNPASYSNKKVIFASDRDGGDYDLYMCDLDGSSLKQLTKNGSDDLYPSASPDGKKIAFTSTIDGLWQIMVMDRDGSNVRQITSTNTLNAYPAWSNDGKYIFYESKVGNDWEIFRINADGSDNMRLTYNPSGDDWHPACHSSEPVLFFETGPAGRENIMAMDYNGQSQKYITNDSSRNRTPDVSAQNDTVVFTRYDKTDGQIFFMDVNGENLRQVTSMGGRNIHPSFSPDGAYVGFDSDGADNLQIYIFSVNDGSLRKLIEDGSNNYKDPFFLFY